MQEFHLGKSSLKKLATVHADLQSIVRVAIKLTEVDFSVIEGLRTPERQEKLIAEGRSWTMKSRHLTGHAVDLVPIVAGVVRWDDLMLFERIATAMFQAADQLDIALQWGGDWDCDGQWRDEQKFDAPHFQLPFPYREKAAREAAKQRAMLGRVLWGEQNERATSR